MFFRLKGAHTYFSRAYVQCEMTFLLHLSFESLAIINTLGL
jgi:hypothetical protein